MPAPQQLPPDNHRRDANGTPIPLRWRVEHIASGNRRRVLLSRPRQQGQGQGANLLFLVFDQRYLVVLPPHRVRVLTTLGGR